MDKREQITNWFKYTKPTLGIILLFCFAGGIATLGGFLQLSSGDFMAYLSLIVGIFFLLYILFMYMKSNNLPSDSQMDTWLMEDINEIIKDRPYNKLGISKNEMVAEPLLVVGPIYWNVSGFDIKDIKMKKGEDGFNRYSILVVQVFLFTENYLCSYKCNYNWLKNTYINESTNEFFYKDVVSVKTDTISSAYTLMNGQKLVHSEAFQLKLSGDEVTVITNDASLNTSSVMTSKAEKAVQSIRAMLRDKKK